MAQILALHRGEFGRAALLKLHSGLLPHAHSEAHIVWWLAGTPVEGQVGSHLWRSVDHEAVGINPYEPHDLRIAGDRPAVCLALYISQDWLARRSAASTQSFRFHTPFLKIDPRLRNASLDFLNALLDEHCTLIVREQRIEQMIDAAVDASITGARPVAEFLTPASLDFRIRRALVFMREHIDARIPVDVLARQVGLSRPHLFAMFREQLNTPPQIYWNALRLDAAINRLMQGDESLTLIAQDLGFSASSNFSRFFRDHTGVTPREYRRAAHEKIALSTSPL